MSFLELSVLELVWKLLSISRVGEHAKQILVAHWHKLIDELCSYEKGKLIYLYTDDNCPYLFYMNKVFERAEEKGDQNGTQRKHSTAYLSAIQ